MDASIIEFEGILYDLKDAKAREMLTPQELATNTDANSVVETGMYYCNYKNTYSNIPAANGWLMVSKVTDTIVKQLFFATERRIQMIFKFLSALKLVLYGATGQEW